MDKEKLKSLQNSCKQNNPNESHSDKSRTTYSSNPQQEDKGFSSFDSDVEKTSNSNYTTNGSDTETEDLTIAVLKNGYFYLCFAESGQKIKIPLSIFKNENAESIDVKKLSEKVDNMDIKSPVNSTTSLPGYSYAKTASQMFDGADMVLIVCSCNPKSYIKALEQQAQISRNLNVYTRIEIDSQVAAIGNIAALSLDENVDEYAFYKFKDQYLIVDYGDGLAYIQADPYPQAFATFPHIVTPSFRDLIKGIIIQICVPLHFITDFLALTVAGFNITILAKEKGQIRNAAQIIKDDFNISISRNVNLTLDGKQTIDIEIDGVIIARNIIPHFDKIVMAQCDSDRKLDLTVSRKGTESIITLYDLIKS